MTTDNNRPLVMGALMIGGGAVALVALLILGAFALFNGGSTATPSPSPTPEPSQLAGLSTTASPTPQNTLEIESFNCTYDASIGFAYVQGEVKNISTDSLSDVTAVGTWYTSAGTFIVSDDALTDFNPILPGQTSPFKTNSTYNPEMSKCDLKFKHLLGDQIPASRPTPTDTPIVVASQLLTPSEIASVLGGNWSEASIGICTPDDCTFGFEEDSGQPFPVLSVSLHVYSLGNSPEQSFYDSHAGAFVHTSLDHAVSGLGDDAYWSQNDGLGVRKGNIDINVAVYPGLGGYRDEGKSLSIAKIVLNNLASR